MGNLEGSYPITADVLRLFYPITADVLRLFVFSSAEKTAEIGYFRTYSVFFLRFSIFFRALSIGFHS
jgi:hypothetical protein